MKKQSTLFMLGIALATAQQVTAQSWNITGNSNATTSSKLGTTNSIPLRLYTNNTQRVTITADGKMGVNITAPPGLFTVQSNGSVPNAKWAPASTMPVFFGFSENLNADFSLAAASSDPKQRPLFFGKRSRGTLASPSAVKTDDYLTSLAVYAYDGSAFQIPATIDFYADGTPSSGKVPSRISFVTGSNASDRLERLKIGSTGDINFNAGQLFVQHSTGNVGIGTTTPNSYKLEVAAGATSGIHASSAGSYAVVGENSAAYGTGVYGTAPASSDNQGIGVHGIGYYGALGSGTYGVYGTGTSYGVYGTADTYGLFGTASNCGVYGSGSSYGVFGSGTTYGVFGSGSSYGVYGTGTTFGTYGRSYGGYGGYFYSHDFHGMWAQTESTSSNIYAGVFQGNVYSYGTYQGSDRNLKKNISDFSDAMNIINKLKPRYYQFKSEGKYAAMNLPKGNHYGLIAQELEEVLPELVADAPQGLGAKWINPDTAEIRKGVTPVMQKSEIEDTKAVNYTELIPILIKGMQELSAKNDELQSQVNELKALIAKGGSAVSSSAGYLKQNMPNPSNGSTVISYSLPDNTVNGQIILTDAKGSTLKAYTTAKGDGNITISTKELPAGTYTYTLYANNKRMDARQMVITR